MLYKVTGAGHSVCVCVCVCVWGGGGGQGRERVQLPDSLVDEAVLQSVGPGLETPQSPPWWQQTEEAVCRVGGITCNVEGFAGETGAVDVLEGGERDTNDLLSCSHYPLKGLAAGHVAGAIPHSDAASQNALDGASVEGAHDGGRGSGSSEYSEFIHAQAIQDVGEFFPSVKKIFSWKRAPWWLIKCKSMAAGTLRVKKAHQATQNFTSTDSTH